MIPSKRRLSKAAVFLGENITNVIKSQAHPIPAPLRGMDEKTILERLDRIIAILQDIAKPPSLGQRIANGAAVGVGILGILTVVETIRSWLGG